MVAKDISLVLSTVATTLAIASFCGTTWRIWRDRPRIVFYVTKANIQDRSGNEISKMIQMKICNIGFRPIIVIKFLALGKNSSYHMGIHDEPAAAYGIEDQRFPSEIKPGGTLTFHPMPIGALENNLTDPKDPKVFFDPYKYFVVVDNFGKFHYIEMNEIKWSLGMGNIPGQIKGIQKITNFCRNYLFFYRAKRQYSKNQL